MRWQKPVAGCALNRLAGCQVPPPLFWAIILIPGELDHDQAVLISRLVCHSVKPSAAGAPTPATRFVPLLIMRGVSRGNPAPVRREEGAEESMPSWYVTSGLKRVLKKHL